MSTGALKQSRQFIVPGIKQETVKFASIASVAHTTLETKVNYKIDEI